LKRILKILTWIFFILIGLVLLLWIAVQFTPVQNFIVKKVTSSLSRTLGTELMIGRVDIDFFNNLTIDEIYLADRNRDTLIALDRLSADIGLFSLLNQKIYLDNIEINNLTANIYKSQSDSLFNFDFILKAFTPDSTAIAPADSTGGAPWDIQFSAIALTDINFTFRDSVSQVYLITDLPQVNLNIDNFDPSKLSANIKSLNLIEPSINIETVSQDRPPSDEPLVYPYTGWDLTADELNIQDGSIRYWMTNTEVMENRFDVEHINITDLKLEAADFTWDTSAMKISLQALQATDHSGLTVNQAEFEFMMSPTEIQVENLTIITPNSLIQNTTDLQFTNWAALNDFLQSVRVESQFNNSTLALEDLDYFIPYIPEDYRISAPVELNGSIELSKANARLEEIDLRIGDLLTFRASGIIEKLSAPKDLQYNLNIQELEVDYKKLRLELPVLDLPDMLDSLGHLRLSGQLAGDMSTLKVKNLYLDTDKNTLLKADGRLTNLDQPENLRFNLQIDSLKTRAEDLAYFSPGPLPQGLYEMGTINYGGILKGGLNDFYTNGKLNSAIGNLETNLGVNFNSDYTNASYDGKVEVKQFDLGRFLQDTLTYGKASLELNLEGQGLSLDSLNGAVDATLGNLTFSGYDYQRVKINGTINEMQFRGKASMDDPNLTFDFDGLVNLNAEVPVFEFEATVDTVDLAALKLSKDTLQFSVDIKSNFRGNNIDDFLGDAILNDLHLSSSTKHFHLDSLLLKASQTSTNNKVLRVRSDLLSATFTGDFKLLDLPVLFENYVNDYFPIKKFLSPVDEPDTLALEPFQQKNLPDQNLEFDVRIYDPTRLTLLFTPVLTRLDSAVLIGKLNTLEKSLEADLDVPIVEVTGWTMDSVHWIAEGDVSRLSADFNMVRLTNGATTLFDNQINTTLGSNRLTSAVSFNNPDRQSAFAWGAKLTPEGEYYQLQMGDTLSIDQQVWTTSEDHVIVFGDSLLRIKNFSVEKNKQSIGIVSYDRESDKDYTPVAIDFKNFKLSEVSSLVNIEGFDFGGLLNGSIVLNDVTENLHYLADLLIEDLTINDSLVGQIELSAAQTTSRPVIDIGLVMSGQGNEMTANGAYNIETNDIQLDANIQRIPLILADPFTQGAIKNSAGYIKGNIQVEGSIDRPDVSGYVQFQDASTTIDYIKTRYTIPDGQINISNDRFTFENMRLLDSQKNEAKLTGDIEHNYFKTYQFNLNFDTDRFRFLNTKSGDNELFYGRLNLAAEVEIRGTLEAPVFKINARTLEDSKLFVSAIVEEQLNREIDYIVYAEPSQLPLDSLIDQQSGSGYIAPKIDLLLNLNLTPAAELVVVVDPITGDQLSSKGNANLTVQMFPTGEISVLGLYTAVSGAYQFSYQNLVKKSFVLQSGSTLNFIGDPLDTRFDITAIYSARTSVYPLIGNESNLSQSDQRLAKGRTDVNVLMSMEGNIDRPEIGFDIQLDDEVSSSLSNVVSQKLSRLREDEAELNKQVFGLLLLNSFVAEQSATAGLSTAGENIALSSVSNLISNQLNRLSERYLDGIGLTFDLESYRAQLGDSGDPTTRTNLNVGLSQSILNDRLTIKVGGVVQVDNGGSATNNNGFSNIAGDFVLEYQLDKSGNYILRVFQRSDYDAFDDANTSKTGAGISFKKSFGQ
jgi:hypothetical protein